MTIEIQYKSDKEDVPFCAYTLSRGAYECAWSAKSFEDAKEKLIALIKKEAPVTPPNEVVEI